MVSHADTVTPTDNMTPVTDTDHHTDAASGDSCESVVKCTDTDVSSEEGMLFVQCGLNTASFYLKRLELGPSNYRGLCVLHDGAWFTPNQFQRVSGRQTAKDWKRSIKHHGRSLKSLLSAGLICLQPPHCRCERCMPDLPASEREVKDGTRLDLSQVSKPADKKKTDKKDGGKQTKKTKSAKTSGSDKAGSTVHSLTTAFTEDGFDWKSVGLQTNLLNVPDDEAPTMADRIMPQPVEVITKAVEVMPQAIEVATKAVEVKYNERLLLQKNKLNDSDQAHARSQLSPLQAHLPQGSPLQGLLPQGSPLQALLPQGLPLQALLPHLSPVPAHSQYSSIQTYLQETSLQPHSSHNSPAPGHSQRHSPDLAHSHRHSPELAHSQRHSPELAHSQRCSPDLAHSQRYSPDLAHSQEPSPVQLHSQQQSPASMHSQRHSPELAHQPRCSPALVNSRQGTPVSQPGSVDGEETGRVERQVAQDVTSSVRNDVIQPPSRGISPAGISRHDDVKSIMGDQLKTVNMGADESGSDAGHALTRCTDDLIPSRPGTDIDMEGKTTKSPLSDLMTPITMATGHENEAENRSPYEKSNDEGAEDEGVCDEGVHPVEESDLAKDGTQDEKNVQSSDDNSLTNKKGKPKRRCLSSIINHLTKSRDTTPNPKEGTPGDHKISPMNNNDYSSMYLSGITRLTATNGSLSPTPSLTPPSDYNQKHSSRDSIKNGGVGVNGVKSSVMSAAWSASSSMSHLKNGSSPKSQLPASFLSGSQAALFGGQTWTAGPSLAGIYTPSMMAWPGSCVTAPLAASQPSTTSRIHDYRQLMNSMVHGLYSTYASPQLLAQNHPLSPASTTTTNSTGGLLLCQAPKLSTNAANLNSASTRHSRHSHQTPSSASKPTPTHLKPTSMATKLISPATNTAVSMTTSPASGCHVNRTDVYDSCGALDLSLKRKAPSAAESLRPSKRSRSSLPRPWRHELADADTPLDLTAT